MELTSFYFAYLFTVVTFNVVDLVATVVSAVQVRKGKQIEWYVYGGLTDLICKPMIKKIFLQSIVSAMLFLIVLFSFSRVDWLSVLICVRQLSRRNWEIWYWDLVSPESAVFLESDTVLAPLDSLLSHLCEANDIRT